MTDVINMSEPVKKPLPSALQVSLEEVSENSLACRKVFSRILRNVLSAKGLPTSTTGASSALSELLNRKVSPSAIQKWLNADRMPDGPMLVELSGLLQVSIDYLLMGEEALRKPHHMDGVPETAVERAEKLQLIDQLVMLPKIAVFDPVRSEKRITAFSRSWLATHFPGVMLQDIDIMIAQGDHMEPSIRQGDEVMYWNSPRFFEDNAIYVLQIGHNRMLRRVRQMVTGDYNIACDNERYPSEIVPSSSFPHPLNLPGSRSLRVIGRVLAVISFCR